MRYKIGAFIAATLLTVLAVTGCSHHHTATSAKAHAAASAVAKNPATVKAENIVKACVTAKHGIQVRALVRCIAPTGHKAALESCLTKALVRDGFLTKADRRRFEQTDAPDCVVNNR